MFCFCCCFVGFFCCFLKVSDGVIAPGFCSEALEILKKKKGGKYCVLQVLCVFFIYMLDLCVHSHSKYGLETQLKSLFYLFVRLYAILCKVHGSLNL